MASVAVAVAVEPDFEPSENWDDDFEFNASPGPSSPASSARTRRPKRSQTETYQPLAGGSASKSSLAVLPAGTRISIASTEFTMEDWDADSVVHQSPPRVTTTFASAIIGGGDDDDDDEEEEFGQTPTKARARAIPRALSGDAHVGVVFHDPHALPVSLSIALAPWSEEPEMLLPKTPVKTPAVLQRTLLGDIEENWDQDFEESDGPAEDAPRRKLSLKARLEEEALESWDEEIAAEEAEAEARQRALQQVDLGMGPPPPASRRTPKKSPTAPRRKVSKGKSGIVPSSSSSSSASEAEDHHMQLSYRRQKPNRNSERSSKARYSLSEDGDFYDSSDDEFGVRHGIHSGEEEEEDKTVTARSRKGLGYFKSHKDASPPPPVPKLPESVFRVPSPPLTSNTRSPSSGAAGPSISPRLSFSPPPVPSASSPTPFPRSPTSSVFSVPTTLAETRSYHSTTHLRPIESRTSSGGGTLANLPPSPPLHKDRERRRLRKKSRPSPGSTYEMGSVSGRSRPRKSGESIAAYPYSFSDGELEDIRERDRERDVEDGIGERILPRRDGGRRTPSPGPQLRASSSGMLGVPAVSVSGASDDGHGMGNQRDEGRAASMPATPKGPGALLSRIGSMTNRWGGRKKRGASGPPSEGDTQATPRPQSSMSSLHLPTQPAKSNSPSSTNSPNGAHVQPSSSSWFFRSSSNTSGVSAAGSSKGGRKSLGNRVPSSSLNGNRDRRVGGDARASLSATDLAHHDESEYEEYGQVEGAHGEWEYSYQQEWDALDDRTPVATPSKLVKRKSLGFVQLRRSMIIGGGEKHKLKVKDRERDGGKESEPVVTEKKKKRASDLFMRTTPSKDSKSDPFVVPFVASGSTSAYAASTPHLLHSSQADRSPNKDELPTSVTSPSPSGLRTIMGNVRRLSIVGAQAAAAAVTTRHRHKRTQSSSAVAGGSTSPEAVARTSLTYARAQTPIRAGGVLGLRRRESGKEKNKEGGSRPLTPSTSVPALQQMYNASGSSRSSVHVNGHGHGRKRSGTDVALKGWADKENRPVFTESEASGTEIESQKGSEVEKDRGALLTEPTRSPNLLPPIELQPPSPPRKSGERLREGEIQPLCLPVPANEEEDARQGLRSRSPSASGLASSSPRTPRRPRDPNSPQSASVGRASPLQPPPPSSFHHHKIDPSAGSSSNSNSTTSTVKASKSKDPLVNVVASSSVLRRNSLGDLKIPARISQAQVSLRRDLGMVREFAGAVESLKDLQDTYHVLSGDLHVLLERHAQASAAATAAARQAQPPAPSPAPDDSQSRPPSSNGFFNLANLSRTHLKFKGRKRSNTNPEGARGSLSGRNTPHHEESVNSSSTQLPLSPGMTTQSLAASQAAYKELATALYSINSKYRISWECAELLIELGSGTTNTDSGGKGSSTSPNADLTAAASASAMALHTGPIIIPQRTASGRERAVTLAGDDRDTSRAGTPVSRSSSRIGSYGYSGHGPPIASPLHGGMTASHSTPIVPASFNGMGTGPPMASPASWRASTGRNDLSQRQLALLRDMLHADKPSPERPPTSMANAPICDSLERSAPGHRSRISISEDARPGSPNREWRWGADAMSSTITLPVTDDEEDGQPGTDKTGDKGKAPKPKKKKLMNMSGFRDMLRALRRGTQQAQEAESSKPRPIQQNAEQGQQALLARSGAAAASTTSLSGGSSYDGHSLNSSNQRHQHFHQRAPQPVQQSQTQRKLIQKRRPKSSAGPEEILAHQQHIQQLQQSQRPAASPPPSAPPPSSFPHPPKSPRRPSLASIFRIGTKSSQQHSSGNATDSASYPHGSSSSSCLGEDDRRPAYVEEEDWDRIDSASDLDGMTAPRANTTIRGGGLGKPQVLEKKMKKRMMLGSGAPPSSTPSIAANPSEPAGSGKRGPYLQQDPYAYRSTSGLGRRIVSASSAPLSSRNASSSSVNAIPDTNGSQASLVAAGSARASKDGPPPAPPVVEGTGSVRQTKLSDVQENEAGEAATRVSTSLSRQTAQAFVHPKGPIASPHTSRSVSASSKLTSNKTGSVRSMPPQPFSPNSISSASGVTSPYTGASPLGSGHGGGYPDIKLTFTPENIKPLLENAKEVQKALKECVEEMHVLVKREEIRLGLLLGPAALDRP